MGPQVFKVLIAMFLFLVCLFLFCLLVFVVVVVVSCAFPPSKSLFPRSNLTSGKIKCVTVCCVTQTEQACELSARNFATNAEKTSYRRKLFWSSNKAKSFHFWRFLIWTKGGPMEISHLSWLPIRDASVMLLTPTSRWLSWKSTHRAWYFDNTIFRWARHYLSAVDYNRILTKIEEMSTFSVIWSEVCAYCWRVNVVIIGMLRAFVLGADKKPETNF